MDPSGQNYYDDASASGAAPPAEVPDKGGKTALIPKSLCPGMKPGDTIELTIKRALDDQFEVVYDQPGPEPAGDDQGTASGHEDEYA